jgi:4-nitrophenyl phosphatase
MKRPRPYRYYLIDIEGVLVRDKGYAPVPGSVAWFNGLAPRGIDSCLVSNNSTHRPADLVAALRGAGFALEADRLVGALSLALARLRERGQRRIMWLGSPGLRDFLAEEGFELVGAGRCDAVVLGVNDALAVADLDRALVPLRDHGADLVCLHRNLFWLDAAGRRRLGPGAWAAALETLLGAGEVAVVGKPEPLLYRAALERLGTTAREALFISDDPQADLVTARRLGMGTAFVLSGKYGDHAVLGEMDQEDWPDVICQRPADIEEALLRNEHRREPGSREEPPPR